MSLIDKIRKARETEVEAGGRKWTIRRPTDEEYDQRGMWSGFDIIKRFTIGWELTEIDLIPGGDGAKVPFNPDLFSEWISDQPDLWLPLGKAILEAYKAHTEKRDAALKNL